VGEIQLAKHLARSDVRRRQQHRRLAFRLAMSTGTAALAVLAVGLQANGAVTAFSHVPAHLPEGITAGSDSGYVAVAAAHESAPVAGVVSASADALLSYSRSVVLTGTKEETGKLNVASAERRRPGPGTLMAPLAALTPSSRYGVRINPITGSAGEFHWGLDFAAACGTHVHSADAGVVRAVGWHQWGGGNRVELDHGNGLITTYNHLEGIAVRQGQSVQAGDIIARVGTTGASTGCHLHFETILNGDHTDPAKWTLQPLHHSEPVAGLTMTDYRTAGTVTDVPAWAVSTAQIHHHEADGRHEAPESKAKVGPSSPVSAPIAARVPSPSPTPAKTVAPAPTAMPAPATAPARPPSAAPTPAPGPKVTQEPVKKPEPEPTAVPSVVETAASSAR
jgi:murein DD-endopeptidase MepM/ murein hydrolase activator NlpD